MTLPLGGRIGGVGPQFRPFISGQIELGGILAGTHIQTPDGDKHIDDLSPGDLITTRNSGSVPLTAVEWDTVFEQTVELTAGSLSHTVPPVTLRLPASQPVLLRDWRAEVMFGQPQAIAPAGTLVDHGFILDCGEQELQVYRLIFERDQVVYAEGVELTSEPIRERVRHVA